MFYAAGVYSDKNPWWPVMPDTARYLQRVSFLLRQGEPVADVALYAPTDDAWSHDQAGDGRDLNLCSEHPRSRRRRRSSRRFSTPAMPSI